MRIEHETAIKKEEDELKAEALKWKISIMKDKGWNEEGAAQSSGGVLLTKKDFVRIINKRRPIPETELRKAFEWKPWYGRREEYPRVRPVPSSNDYDDRMKSQVDILEKAKETLMETKDEDFYRVHSEYIEDAYFELDEDSRVEFKTFMLELY